MSTWCWMTPEWGLKKISYLPTLTNSQKKNFWFVIWYQFQSLRVEQLSKFKVRNQLCTPLHLTPYLYIIMFLYFAFSKKVAYFFNFIRLMYICNLLILESVVWVRVNGLWKHLYSWPRVNLTFRILHYTLSKVLCKISS